MLAVDAVMEGYKVAVAVTAVVADPVAVLLKYCGCELHNAKAGVVVAVSCTVGSVFRHVSEIHLWQSCGSQGIAMLGPLRQPSTVHYFLYPTL